jgi:methylisocitrate lyase
MSERLRASLAEAEPVVAPCAYDCISAKLAEAAGFKAILHGNYNCAASLLGMPDVGVISMAESVWQAGRIAQAVDIPVFCDVDDGYGDIVNVARMSREVMRAGCAGMYIEDQEAPKRCPSLGGSGVIPTKAMVRKLKAICKVRADEDPEFFLIARTHAGRVVNLDDAVRRSIAYAEAGADAIFFDPGYSDIVYEEFRTIVEKVGPHAMLVANMTENVGRPMITTEELAKMGFHIVIYPLTLVLTAAEAVKAVLEELMAKGTTAGLADRMMHVRRLADLMGMDEVREWEKFCNPDA